MRDLLDSKADKEKRELDQRLATVQSAGIKGIERIVGGQRVCLAIEREFSILDTVAKTSDGGAEVAGIGQPAIEGIVAVCDIGNDAIFVGNFD